MAVLEALLELTASEVMGVWEDSFGLQASQGKVPNALRRPLK